MADLTGIGAAIEGAGMMSKALSDYFNTKRTDKTEKKRIKETKRKTLSDLLNEALNRTHDSEKSSRQSQNELAMARARALQEMAANYRMR